MKETLAILLLGVFLVTQSANSATLNSIPKAFQGKWEFETAECGGFTFEVDDKNKYLSLSVCHDNISYNVLSVKELAKNHISVIAAASYCELSIELGGGYGNTDTCFNWKKETLELKIINGKLKPKLPISYDFTYNKHEAKADLSHLKNREDNIWTLPVSLTKDDFIHRLEMAACRELGENSNYEKYKPCDYYKPSSFLDNGNERDVIISIPSFGIHHFSYKKNGNNYHLKNYEFETKND